jgi:hypothetical protein
MRPLCGLQRMWPVCGLQRSSQYGLQRMWPVCGLQRSGQYGLQRIEKERIGKCPSKVGRNGVVCLTTVETSLDKLTHSWNWIGSDHVFFENRIALLYMVQLWKVLQPQEFWIFEKPENWIWDNIDEKKSSDAFIVADDLNWTAVQFAVTVKQEQQLIERNRNLNLLSQIVLVAIVLVKRKEVWEFKL